MFMHVECVYMMRKHIAFLVLGGQGLRDGFHWPRMWWPVTFLNLEWQENQSCCCALPFLKVGDGAMQNIC